MPTKEEARKKIESLVERFDEQRESYKKADCNETQTRRDFIVNNPVKWENDKFYIE